MDQAIELIREGMLAGRWRGTLPGRERLAQQLGCSHGTVESAMRQLAREGWLISQGSGRRRRISIPARQARAANQVKRVRILPYDEMHVAQPTETNLLTRLQVEGHAASFSMKSLQDMGMDVARVARFVKSVPCDAWIVCSASQEVLHWFAEQSTPAIALFGSFSKVPIAATCPRKSPAMLSATRRLVDLGHQRIVLTTSPERVSPKPALFEQAFLDELQRLGLPTGPYNLPTFEKHAAGVTDCLNKLFQLTPPTAIIIGDGEHLMAIQQFLARRGLRVPEDISLLSTDHAPDYRWCDPPISHLRWDAEPLIRRVIRWVERISHGKPDIRQQLFDAEFIEGGTIGPAPHPH